jgi:hypothetical protein
MSGLGLLPCGLAIFMWVATAGCGSSDELNRQPVSGVVTLDGAPVAMGAILFEPATGESGTAVGAQISQGIFAISAAEGPVPGSYLVRLYSASDTQASPRKGQTDRSARPMVERFPPCYNSETELRARVLNRSPNRFRFDLRSKQTNDTP